MTAAHHYLISNADGNNFPIEVLLDTGFTNGWLAVNSQDVEVLGWSFIQPRQAMQTARGVEFFDVYQGKVLLDGQEFIIPVVAGSEITEVLLGLQWLKTLRLVVDFSQAVLTLGESGESDKPTTLPL